MQNIETKFQYAIRYVETIRNTDRITKYVQKRIPKTQLKSHKIHSDKPC